MRPFKITVEDTLEGKKSKRGLKGGCKENQNFQSAKQEKINTTGLNSNAVRFKSNFDLSFNYFIINTSYEVMSFLANKKFVLGVILEFLEI